MYFYKVPRYTYITQQFHETALFTPITYNAPVFSISLKKKSKRLRMGCNLKSEHIALDNATLLGNILKFSLARTSFHTLGRLENVIPSQKF